MTISPVTLGQARDKARAFYESHSRAWAAGLFMHAIEPDRACAEVALSIPLHPPTESAVLQHPAEIREWARSWSDIPDRSSICWSERRWPSVGRQSIPERLRLSGPMEISAFAGKRAAWLVLQGRTLALADRWNMAWRELCPAACRENFPSRLQRAAGSYQTMAESDWQMLIRALDWLLAHPGENRYARELPIRGIDTKWIERHKKEVSHLHAALTDSDDIGIVLKAPTQTRVRFLDAALAPCGLRDISAAPEELDRYDKAPKTVIICENLISVMTLPNLEGVVAIHGGGYGVVDLGAIRWLASTPVLYWGDLDSHGFAILNQWRHHHAHTRSLMMDEETLLRHRDLCTTEPTPSEAELDRLTGEELSALGMLSENGNALRLEQERIEWGYALQRIEAALKELTVP